MNAGLIARRRDKTEDKLLNHLLNTLLVET